MLKNLLYRGAQNSSDNVSDSLRHAIVTSKRIFFTTFVQNLDEFGREPTLVSIQFSHPTVVVFLGNDGDDVIFTEAQFVVIATLEIQYCSRSFTLRSGGRCVDLVVFEVTLGRVIRLELKLRFFFLGATQFMKRA